MRVCVSNSPVYVGSLAGRNLKDLLRAQLNFDYNGAVEVALWYNETIARINWLQQREGKDESVLTPCRETKHLVQ